jgi:hypothetical protein
MGRVDVLVRQILTSVLLGSMVVLVACSSTGSNSMKDNVTSAKPLIDSHVPTAIETATFALG